MNGNYGWGLPIQASTFAKEIDLGIYAIHGIMFAIFILWSVFFVYLLVRYRARPGVPSEHWETGTLQSMIPDLIVLGIEICLILFYALPAWSRIKMTVPPEGKSNVVEIVAEQFAWTVHYPGADAKFGRSNAALVDAQNPAGLDAADDAGKDDVVTVNELHIPLGKPTVVYLSSKDVIHSLFIPEFRVKQDAMPGMKIPVWFEPTLTGKFEIGCAQLCGIAHSIMRADVFVHTPEEYEKWLAAQHPQTQPY
ncbi:MAG: hypothetical protein HY078_10880 [Elusimicrobia bacterium]|nr:hypothetical protein [Elusimicrobiota bacterium]